MGSPTAVPSDAVEIIVDDREMRSEVVRHLSLQAGVGLTVRRLKVGDYFVNGRVVIERKTLNDLILSIKDGRLFRQAGNLASVLEIPLMVIEGSYNELDGCGMRREAIQGALLSVALVFGVHVLESRDAADTATLIISAQRQSALTALRRLPRLGKRPTSRRRLQCHILQGLPGIGPDRAEYLLRLYGSVAGVINAPAEELAAVPGIGRRTAEKIRSSVDP